MGSSSPIFGVIIKRYLKPSFADRIHAGRTSMLLKYLKPPPRFVLQFARLSLVNSKVTPQDDWMSSDSPLFLLHRSMVQPDTTRGIPWYNQGCQCHWRTCQKFRSIWSKTMKITSFIPRLRLQLTCSWHLEMFSAYHLTWGNQNKLSKLSNSAPVALRVPHVPQPHLSTCGQQDRERPHSVKPGRVANGQCSKPILE